jgi:hypothetical protein
MLVNRRAGVIRIIDAANAVASVEWYTQRKEVVGHPRMGIIVDRTDEHHGMVWLRMPTAGMVQGRLFNTNQVFVVTGTTTYRTDRGSWALPVLQMLEQPAAAVPAK